MNIDHMYPSRYVCQAGCASWDANAPPQPKHVFSRSTEDHLGGIRGYEFYGAMTEALHKDVEIFRRAFVREHPWGTPDQVIAKTEQLTEAFRISEIIFIFKYGGMPMKAAEKSMQLFAREVMPAFKELHPQPLLAEAS